MGVTLLRAKVGFVAIGFHLMTAVILLNTYKKGCVSIGSGSIFEITVWKYHVKKCHSAASHIYTHPPLSLGYR